eukprot:466335_1
MNYLTRLFWITISLFCYNQIIFANIHIIDEMGCYLTLIQCLDNDENMQTLIKRIKNQLIDDGVFKESVQYTINYQGENLLNKIQHNSQLSDLGINVMDLPVFQIVNVKTFDMIIGDPQNCDIYQPDEYQFNQNTRHVGNFQLDFPFVLELEFYLKINTEMIDYHGFDILRINPTGSFRFLAVNLWTHNGTFSIYYHTGHICTHNGMEFIPNRDGYNHVYIRTNNKDGNVQMIIDGASITTSTRHEMEKINYDVTLSPKSGVSPVSITNLCVKGSSINRADHEFPLIIICVTVIFVMCMIGCICKKYFL